MSTDENKIDEIELLREVIEPIKRERYSAGFRAAVAALRAAIEKIESEGPEEAAAVAGGGKTGVIMLRSPHSRSGPKQGTTPWYVLNVVKSRPGLTSGELMEAVKDAGLGAPPGSIKTNIFRLKERNFIVARHGKWFPK